MKKFLLLSGLFFAVHFFAFADTKIEAPAPLSKNETTVPIEDSEKLAIADDSDQDIPDPFNNGAEDPFQSNPVPGEPMLAVQDPILQGLAIGHNKSTAVINGKTYVQGEGVRDGIELVEVRKKEADINLSGIFRTIRLVPELRTEEKPDAGLPQADPSASQDSVSTVFEEANMAISEVELTEMTKSFPDSPSAPKKESL